MSVFDRGIVRALPLLPRGVVRRIASPYIAGEQLGDARRVVATLNAAGKAATVDVLGEEIDSPREARALAAAYRDVFDGIRADGLDANISIKPTALGLTHDLALCRAELTTLVVCAERQGGFVRIDMEDSSTTDATLDLYRSLRASGHDRVGVVLQSRLRRSLDDIAALAPLAPSVRLCKGIYLEPAAIAHTDFHAIRAAYVRCAEALLDAGATVAFATHDEYLIAEAKRLVAERGLGRDRFEFQLLLGVREGIADALVREGFRVRIYVPYGERWYEYSLRRLRENPRIATYVASDTVKRVAASGGRR